MRPSVIDDFIRNFLIKVGMARTLDSFNTEWYELQAKGRLGEEYVTKVPDIYLRNEELDEQASLIAPDRRDSLVDWTKIHHFDTLVVTGTYSRILERGGRGASAFLAQVFPLPTTCR